MDSSGGHGTIGTENRFSRRGCKGASAKCKRHAREKSERDAGEVHGFTLHGYVGVEQESQEREILRWEGPKIQAYDLPAICLQN